MTWPTLTIAGNDYDFPHLTPFVMAVTPKAKDAPTFQVLVTFGSHTFTKDWTGNDPLDHQIPDGSGFRCFCPLRYGCSKELPRIIAYAAKGRAFFSEGRNMLLIEHLPGLTGPYAVFFNLEKAKEKGLDAVMFVVSAYEKLALPDRLPAMTFATLVSTVVGGGIIRPPRDLRSIKK